MLMFTDEENELRAVLRRAIEAELGHDVTRVSQTFPYPAERLRSMAKIGVAGYNLAPAYGGEEVSFVVEAIAAEELARIDFNASFWYLGSRKQGKLIELGASDRFKDEYLPKIVQGEIWTAFGLTEPASGNDVRGMTTKAVRTPDGWCLSGEKTSVSGGMLSSFANIVANAIVDGRDMGMVILIVPFDLPGVERQPFNDGAVIPSGRVTVYLDDVLIPDENRIGEIGRGMHSALDTLQAARPTVGLMALGLAQRTLEEACDYAKTREVFGGAIGRFQSVSHRIANADADIHAARLVCYDALRHLDVHGADEYRTSRAKLIATETATRVIGDLMHLWGHYAYSRDLPLMQRLADAMSTLAWDGTSDIHRNVIARNLLGRDLVKMSS